MSVTEARRHDVRGRLVRIAFLVRLLAVSYTILSMVVHGNDVVVTLVILLLLVTSHLGLQYEFIRALVVRHPFVALVDLLPVALAPLLIGPDSPLSLVALSSGLLIGVLFRCRTAVPLVALLATVQLLASLTPHADPVSALWTPVALLTLAALGAAVRRMAEQQSASEHQQILAMQAAAAAQERLRLARDLHDTVAKAVQGIALTAAALPAWIERDPAQASRHAAALADGAREAVSAARDLLTSLRLDDPERPLADVVDELVYRWEADHGHRVARAVHDVADLPPGHRHELVLSLTEALENVRRHAPGAAVRVALEQVDRAVVLTINDDGPGFAEEREREAVEAGHFGLTGVRERMLNVTGTATIRSAPGRGTEVRLEVPCDPPALVPRAPHPQLLTPAGVGITSAPVGLAAEPRTTG